MREFFFSARAADARMNGSSYSTQFYMYVRFCAFFACWQIVVSKSNNVENIAPTCNATLSMRWDGRNTRVQNWKKMMRAHPHVRLDHGSKDTAHVRVDTISFWGLYFNYSLLDKCVDIFSYSAGKCHWTLFNNNRVVIFELRCHYFRVKFRLVIKVLLSVWVA